MHTNIPIIFEYLIHFLELSVVFGIGVIVYITKKYPRPQQKQNFLENQKINKNEDTHLSH